MSDNPMREIRIGKVTINIGVGEGGERLDRAVKLLERLTGHKPIKTRSYKRIPAFNIRPNSLCGAKVTLRKKDAEDFLVKAFEAVDNVIKAKNFDKCGNFAFGIKESIDIPGYKYDSKIGVFGMDVCVTVVRPGYRIRERKLQRKKIPKTHMVTKEEAIEFVREKFNVRVE